MIDDSLITVHAVLRALQSKFRNPDPVDDEDNLTIRCPDRVLHITVTAAIEMALKEMGHIKLDTYTSSTN